VSRPLRPDLVTGGGVLFQLGVPPGDEDSVEDSVVVGGEGQPNTTHGLAAPVQVPVKSCVDPGREIGYLDITEVFAANLRRRRNKCFYLSRA
jgi:hypothetical protein